MPDRRSCSVLTFTFLLFVSVAGASTIDFEDPPMGFLNYLVINPYIDPVTGVKFKTDGSAAPALTVTIGLVRNSATSACAPPADGNQKLASGIETANGPSIGFSSLPIVAEFPVPLSPPAHVSVEVQALEGTSFRLSLYGLDGVLLESVVQVADLGVGSCVVGRDPAAVLVIEAGSSETVYSARIEQLDYSVYVADNFTFCSANEVCGDVDGDCSLTVDDLNLLRDAYFGFTNESVATLESADLDCDGMVTIADIILLAGLIHGYGPEPCCVPPPKRQDWPGRGADTKTP